MNIESNNNVNTKKAVLVPIMSIAIFIALIFSAGYAFYSMNTTKAANTAYGNIGTPGRPTLVCNKTDSAVTVSLANMLSANVGSIAGKATPKLTCTCSGSGNCLFDVTLNAPAGSGNLNLLPLIAANEVTSGITLNRAQLASTCANKAVANFANTSLTGCKLAAGQSVIFTATINFYNINSEQGERRNNQVYKFTLASSNPTFTT